MKSILSSFLAQLLLLLHATTSHSQLAILDQQQQPLFPFASLPVAFAGESNLQQQLLQTSIMATLHEHRSEWHPGEVQIHELLHVPLREGNPTAHGLPGPYGYRVAASPLVAVGALDAAGRPWTTVWGGQAGFARPIAPSVLGLQSLADARHDPVVDALFGHRKHGGELVRPLQEGNGQGPLMAGLSIDLETRDRVKLAGRMIAGAVLPHNNSTASPSTSSSTPSSPEGGEGDSQPPHLGEVQLAMLVQESLGNCPKYLNKKTIRPHEPRPELVSDGLPLPPAAVALLEKADLFFLSTTDGSSMDTNHRGGSPGFMRLAVNKAAGPGEGGEGATTTLVYPEYSGNRLYQTLGNLQVRPRVGVAVPDFDTGDVLYLTGTTETLIGDAAAAYLPRSKLAVKIAVTEARFVRDGLPFRGDPGELSPYNPPVRRAATEETPIATGVGGVVVDSNAPPPPPAAAVARLVSREILTPTVARFAFELVEAGEEKKKEEEKERQLLVWKAGQYVTLNFAPELDAGWSHMRDDDPLSLNDDFIRTFTVSSTPQLPGSIGGNRRWFEITARRHGPATALLWRQNLRSELEIPVLAFGGEDAFRIPRFEDASTAEVGPDPVFVAAGVGVTPLLAQAPGLLATTAAAAAGDRSGTLRVLWSLRAEDLPLAVDSFKRIEGLAPRVKLFVTGKSAADGDARLGAVLDEIRELGAEVAFGRITGNDVLGVGEKGKRKYYLCTGAELQQRLLDWLQGEEVVWESFAY